MKVMKFFMGFLIIVLFTLFATANIEEVHVNLFNKNQSILGYSEQETPATAPLYQIIYAAFGAGFIVAWLLTSSLAHKHKRSLKKLQKQYKTLKTETEQLRNLPVKDPEKDSDQESDDAVQDTDTFNTKEDKA